MKLEISVIAFRKNPLISNNNTWKMVCTYAEIISSGNLLNMYFIQEYNYHYFEMTLIYWMTWKFPLFFQNKNYIEFIRSYTCIQICRIKYIWISRCPTHRHTYITYTDAIYLWIAKNKNTHKIAPLLTISMADNLSGICEEIDCNCSAHSVCVCLCVNVTLGRM